ncbi:MAG: amidohydrolase family protein [Chloroflexi bacterium]|nr:amidohydrolase family protein [Chloroflexota bacterium]
MSYNGNIVIDTDSHIREYWELDRTYKDHIDPAYRETYARFSEAVRAQQRGPGDVGFPQLFWPRHKARPLGAHEAFEVDVKEIASSNGSAPGRPTVTGRGHDIDPSCNWDPAVRLRDMEIAGVDVSFMFPSQADGFCMLGDVGFESALHHAYHRFMSDYCSGAGGRLWWMGCLTMRDLPTSIAQLQYWAKEDPHFAGMHLPRACPDGRMLDNPDLYPFYAACEELDLPVWVHGGSNRPPFTPWVAAPNGLYHAIGGQYALAALVGGGVFDLFPKLRIGLFENFCGWMPYLIEKLDDGFKKNGALTPKMKRNASEIAAGGQLFCAAEADEAHTPYAIESLGEDIWLFSTDYPHGGSPWPDGVKLITEQDMPESAKVKLLGTNALRFLPRLAGVASKVAAVSG